MQLRYTINHTALDGTPLDRSFAPLTQREKECLGWASQGKSAKQIASILHISQKTIEHHLLNTRLKLRSCNITQAVYKAVKLDIL